MDARTPTEGAHFQSERQNPARPSARPTSGALAVQRRARRRLRSGSVGRARHYPGSVPSTADADWKGAEKERWTIFEERASAPPTSDSWSRSSLLEAAGIVRVEKDEDDARYAQMFLVKEDVAQDSLDLCCARPSVAMTPGRPASSGSQARLGSRPREGPGTTP